MFLKLMTFLGKCCHAHEGAPYAKNWNQILVISFLMNVIRKYTPSPHFEVMYDSKNG